MLLERNGEEQKQGVAYDEQRDSLTGRESRALRAHVIAVEAVVDVSCGSGSADNFGETTRLAIMMPATCSWRRPEL